MSPETLGAVSGIAGAVLGSVVTGVFGVVNKYQENKGKALDRSYDSRRALYGEFMSKASQAQRLCNRDITPLSTAWSQSSVQLNECMRDMETLSEAIRIDGPKPLRDATLKLLMRFISFQVGSHPEGVNVSRRALGAAAETFAREARAALGNPKD